MNNVALLVSAILIILDHRLDLGMDNEMVSMIGLRKLTLAFSICVPTIIGGWCWLISQWPPLY